MHKPDTKLSQRDMLREAAWTEIYNSNSLSALKKMEDDRKKEHIQRKEYINTPFMKTVQSIKGNKFATKLIFQNPEQYEKYKLLKKPESRIINRSQMQNISTLFANCKVCRSHIKSAVCEH